ncbi:gamma-glutamylaminecyclotransferase C isoform X1 [Carassius auratus]|uniref:Gamma-glutamylaminecyclotransferase n=2 Tax=Carassius auratus TaxID=7957 RepID=A0A6P6PKZ7_CARAU|nr:gamma-glutamylaminecyclotransferase C-like isoform X1 [Carassius auratus]
MLLGIHYIICVVFPVVLMSRVFVYGTLKKGQPNFMMLDAANGRAEFLARARTVDRYPLVIATKYNIPFLLNVPGKGQRVHGEIYSVDQQMMHFLDRFEGCPEMYQRTTVQLEVQDGDGEGENTLKPGSLVETFVYSTTTYQPEWLQKPTYENYDSKGDHGLEFVSGEGRSPE